MNSIEFPTVVYRTPGAHQCAGGTYGYVAADTPEQFERLIADGWFPSLQEAISGEMADPSLSHEGQNQQAMELSDIPPALAIEFVQHWLGHRLEEFGIEPQEAAEDELLERKQLEAIRIDAAAIALQAANDADQPRLWLFERATSLGLEVEDSLTADELLLLICHEYAKPAAEDADNADNADNAQPTREEMEVKAKELGIHFDGRTTDKSLAEKIEHVLSEQE